MEYNLVTSIRLLDSIKQHRNKDVLNRTITENHRVFKRMCIIIPSLKNRKGWKISRTGGEIMVWLWLIFIFFFILYCDFQIFYNELKIPLDNVNDLYREACFH